MVELGPRGVAFILCLLTGIFGIHRFVFGRWKTGLLYLCTGGLFTIGVMVDIVLILFGLFKDKDGFQLKEW
jgi:TM2 domain-containing membrane protein YozV